MRIVKNNFVNIQTHIDRVHYFFFVFLKDPTFLHRFQGFLFSLVFMNNKTKNNNNKKKIGESRGVGKYIFRVNREKKVFFFSTNKKNKVPAKVSKREFVRK